MSRTQLYCSLTQKCFSVSMVCDMSCCKWIEGGQVGELVWQISNSGSFAYSFDFSGKIVSVLKV